MERCGKSRFQKLSICEVGMGILDIFHIQVLAFIILEYLSTCKKKKGLKSTHN